MFIFLEEKIEGDNIKRRREEKISQRNYLKITTITHTHTHADRRWRMRRSMWGAGKKDGQ